MTLVQRGWCKIHDMRVRNCPCVVKPAPGPTV